MLFKMILKMLVVPMFLLGGLGFYLYTTTGEVPFIGGMIGGGSGGDSLKSLREKITHKGNAEETSKKLTFFKWQDESGQWHYGEKPPEGTDSRTVNYDPNQNIISAVKVQPRQGRDDVRSSNDNLANSGSFTGAPSDAYNPSNVTQTISDAKNMQKMLDDRHKQQTEMLNNLR